MVEVRRMPVASPPKFCSTDMQMPFVEKGSAGAIPWWQNASKDIYVKDSATFEEIAAIIFFPYQGINILVVSKKTMIQSYLHYS
jgi:hypothetical protein